MGLFPKFQLVICFFEGNSGLNFACLRRHFQSDIKLNLTASNITVLLSPNVSPALFLIIISVLFECRLAEKLVTVYIVRLRKETPTEKNPTSF